MRANNKMTLFFIAGVVTLIFMIVAFANGAYGAGVVYALITGWLVIFVIRYNRPEAKRKRAERARKEASYKEWGKASETSRRKEETYAPYAPFSEWLARCVDPMPCPQCLGNRFLLSSYAENGLSFEAQCDTCGEKKWCRVKDNSYEPFDFPALMDAWDGCLGRYYLFFSGSTAERIKERRTSTGYVRKSIPKRIQREVWRRDSARCMKCGSQKRLEYDHIIPVSRGGANTARNIQLLCETCNRRKHAKIG